MDLALNHVLDPNGELSHHSAHGFELHGLFWPTIEHNYQAHKFVGTLHAKTIRQSLRPVDAKRLG